MSIEITTLRNGLRVVSHEMPHLETTSLGIWVGAGARDETEAEHGISHLLEHMAFKGTQSRSARDIAEEIEAVGGELNAATGPESTGYFARVLAGDEGVALEILADILQNSMFSAAELRREREVVIQEIAGVRDSPEEIAVDLLHEAAYPRQAVGRSILGTPASLSAIKAQQLKVFSRKHYSPANMVLSAAGGVSHRAVVRHAEALFGGLSGVERMNGEAAVYEGGTRALAKPFEQCHLMIGFEGPSYRDPRFYAAQVTSGILGGGLSSRLFQEVRERRGLCYSVESSAWGMKDTGMFVIHAATGAGTMTKLTDVITGELKALGAKGPTKAELERAKAQMKAGLLMSLESSSARAEQMARQLLTFDRLFSAAELVENVDAVTAAQVRGFSSTVAEGVPSVVVVGAGRQSKEHASYAARRARA
jgi:predicted Zn-dependent peptidase